MKFGHLRITAKSTTLTLLKRIIVFVQPASIPLRSIPAGCVLFAHVMRYVCRIKIVVVVFQIGRGHELFCKQRVHLVPFRL